MGCISRLGEGVGGAGRCAVHPAGGGRRQECNAGDAGEGIFQVKDDTKVTGSHDPVPTIAQPIDGVSSPQPCPAREQPVGRVRAQAGLRFLRRRAESPETFLLIKV